MSQSYQKPCRDCKQEITMMELNGKWGAYNLDGSYHQCKKNGKDNDREPIVAIAPEPKHEELTLQQIDVRLKRVEKMLFNSGT